MPGQAQHGIRALPWAVCCLGTQGSKCWGEGRGLTGDGGDGLPGKWLLSPEQSNRTSLRGGEGGGRGGSGLTGSGETLGPPAGGFPGRSEEEGGGARRGGGRRRDREVQVLRAQPGWLLAGPQGRAEGHFPTSLSFQVQLSLRAALGDSPAQQLSSHKGSDSRLWSPVPALFGTHTCSRGGWLEEDLLPGLSGRKQTPGGSQARRAGEGGNRMGWTPARSGPRAASRSRTGCFCRNLGLRARQGP